MNQPLAFGVLGAGGILVTKALTGSTFRDVVRGHPGSVSSAGSAIAGAGVAGVGSAITTAAAAANAPATVRKMLATAKALDGSPYSQANHAAAFTQTAAQIHRLGVDCSGFVSILLGPAGAGILTAPQTTQTLPGSAGVLAGPGRYVTIYDRTVGPTAQEHAIIDIAGQWFQSGGGGGGVNQMATPDAATLATFDRILHPAGL